MTNDSVSSRLESTIHRLIVISLRNNPCYNEDEANREMMDIHRNLTYRNNSFSFVNDIHAKMLSILWRTCYSQNVVIRISPHR